MSPGYSTVQLSSNYIQLSQGMDQKLNIYKYVGTANTGDLIQEAIASIIANAVSYQKYQESTYQVR